MKFLTRLLALSALLIAGPALADTSILDWTANTETDLAGYKVYQSTVSGSYGAPVATLGKVVTHTLTLPTLTVDTRYYFTLTAYDLTGNESPRSAEVSKIALVAPTAPTLTLTALSPTSIRIVWPQILDVAGVPVLVDIRLAVSPINWGTAASITCLTGSPCTISGLLPVTTYQLEAVSWRTNSSAGKVYSVLGPIATITTPAVVTDLPPTAPVGVTVR